MEIDIKTLFYLFSSGNFFITFFFLAYIQLYKIKNPVINIFIISRILFFSAYLLAASRNSIPNLYSIYFANVFVIFATFYEIYCIASANQQFSKKQFLSFNTIPFLFSILIIIFSSTIYNTRIVLISILIISLYFSGGMYLIIAKSKSKMQHFIGYLFIILAIMLTTHSIVTYNDPSIVLSTNNYIQIASYISVFLVSSSLSIALLFILNQQAYAALVQSELHLKEANATKDKFFSIIAHDLKSPFNALIGFSDLLLEDIRKNEYDTVEKYGTIIQNTSKNTMDLLNNLLDWARAQSGKIKFEPKRFNITNLIEEVFNNSKGAALQKKIILSHKLPLDLHILADQNMINTIIRNLISNSIKYTKSDGKINVSVVDHSDELRVSVSDTGIGIVPENIQKLFKIESNFNTPGTAKERGTGLGLILCKEFVERHGGNIWIDSELGKGSVFTFTIPKPKTN